jgi:thiopeptide-type bacteriocin biosynthesis protein
MTATPMARHDPKPEHPPPSGRPDAPWRQVTIYFDDYATAEEVGIHHLAPRMTSAEDTGLISSWFFVRKAPCWRLRFLSSQEHATTSLCRWLESMANDGHITSWTETIYEPEVHAFGGPEATRLAHRLFHADSRSTLTYLAKVRARSPGQRDQRRELSVLLCSTLMRSAGQDWYEQGDIWARVAEARPPPRGTPVRRLHILEAGLRQLMTADTSSASPLMQTGPPLASAAAWLAAFSEMGEQLGHLAHRGTLRRGIRAVLTHHVIFHWNRLGVPYATQRRLANVARDVVMGS